MQIPRIDMEPTQTSKIAPGIVTSFVCNDANIMPNDYVAFGVSRH